MGEKITDNLKTSKLLCIGNEDERVFAISKVKDEIARLTKAMALSSNVIPTG